MAYIKIYEKIGEKKHWYSKQKYLSKFEKVDIVGKSSSHYHDSRGEYDEWIIYLVKDGLGKLIAVDSDDLYQ